LICKESKTNRTIFFTAAFAVWLSLGILKGYRENQQQGNRSVEALPRDFLEKLKNLNVETLDNTMEHDLTDDEIRAVLKRRDLIVEDIYRLIQEKGKQIVLCQPLQ
jgi:hypothetical protein